jgi:uncharacterized cupredoxin-like copper-binding protein
MSPMHAMPVVAALSIAAVTFQPRATGAPAPSTVNARLSEWKVELSQPTVAAGPVTFSITNSGTIPHAFEVEGQGLEKETAVIQPGGNATLTLTLQPGGYEIYCPIGNGSHKHLGMLTRLRVTVAGAGAGKAKPMAMASDSHGGDVPSTRTKVQSIRVTGGGPVIQILPGPFPFPDSAAPILKEFGDEREGLESQVKNGPYSNNVAKIDGTFSLTAWDKGAVRDSVKGAAAFTTQDGARWRLLLDRVQTKDVPHHPRFGGVIMGLYYHGNTGVHTPLVPTITSAVALWSVGHLYRNDSLVTNNAMVHVMLLSRTRRAGDFALECWDCSRNPVDELQLQVLPGPGEPQFDAPGGFLFVNWEKSTGKN